MDDAIGSKRTTKEERGRIFIERQNWVKGRVI